MQVVRSKGATSEATPIESVKCGDYILAASENGTITAQPVIFVTDHEPTMTDFVEITLRSGKRVTPTHNHMMVVRADGSYKLKLAALVEPGDAFCSRTAEGEVVEDPVASVRGYSAVCLAVNVLIPDGYMLVNDIVGSHRTDGDFSDTLKRVGELVYCLLGTAAVIQFCKFGNWFCHTWLDRLLP